jgi:hypothetical protein
MERWEYKQLVITNKDTDSEMSKINKLGLEGWEMVGFTTIFVKGGFLGESAAANQYIFKRKLQINKV